MRKCYHDMDSPIGTLRIVGDDRQVERIDLPNRAAEQPDAAWLDVRGTLPAALGKAVRQLSEYFSGTRRDFDLTLAAAGTPFQRRVRDELRRIPYAETRSYGALARRLGVPASARAVGGAAGRNPVPIVVPCHRVIGARGALVGYAGGFDAKEALLAHERRVARR